jgi:hypothetical protein
MKPEETLAWTHDGTGKLLAALAGLSDEALTAPTALPARRSSQGGGPVLPAAPPLPAWL